jgi:PEP-CTERM motif
MKNPRRNLPALIATLLVCHPSSQAQTVIYTFESPQFGLYQASPFLNEPPNIGSSTFLASFTSSPGSSAFTISSWGPNPSFSGQILMDTSPPGSADVLTVTVNSPINAVQLDFALFTPGYLELQSSAGTITASTGAESQGGSLFFQSATGFTQFQLLGFGNVNQAVQLAIDNLTMTLVPEPGTLSLVLAGMGLIGGTVRRRRSR